MTTKVTRGNQNRQSNAGKGDEAGITSMLAALNEKMEQVLKEVADTRADMKTVLDQTQELRASHEELSCKVRAIDGDLAKTEIAVHDLQQENLANSIELSGIKQTAGEDLKQVVVAVLEKVGVGQLERDIDYVYRKRVEKKGANFSVPSIIVCFTRKSSAKALLAKKVRTLSLDELDGENLGSGKCFINAHLTQRNKYLLHLAKEQVRKGCIKFAWFANGSVLIRQSEESRVVKVKDIQNITQFDPQRTNNPADE